MGVVPLVPLFVVLASLAACDEGADDITDPDVNVLRGVVVRAGTEVLLADVPVTLGSRTVRSSDRGGYRFDDISPGEATLSVSFAGFLPYERLMILEEGVTNFDIALIPDD